MACCSLWDLRAAEPLERLGWKNFVDVGVAVVVVVAVVVAVAGLAAVAVVDLSCPGFEAPISPCLSEGCL